MTFTSWLRVPRQYRKIDKERVLGIWVTQEEYSRSSLVSGRLASGHISIHLGVGFLKSLSKDFVNISNLIYLTLVHKTGRKCTKMAVYDEVCSCALVHVSVFPRHCALPPPSSLGSLSALDWTFWRLTQKGLSTMNPSHPDSAGKERNVLKCVRPVWGQTPEL